MKIPSNGCLDAAGTRRPLAETDILEIWDDIADDSLAAADRWVGRLDEQFRVLATQPLMGRHRLPPDTCVHHSREGRNRRRGACLSLPTLFRRPLDK
ncbi:MAG: type II toxin-antitoxin system RelE/ParE family toxin [Betaproteobacteria bacterium]|nr:type II toxin-antitoxin system RelE/ParE family toxin [Betaproteobacteria bacterium]MBI2961594.1 type II toxin-antitoxin system RelE/ParE family toxin [Betaproteobacteria bacterium]